MDSEGVNSDSLISSGSAMVYLVSCIYTAYSVSCYIFYFSSISACFLALSISAFYSDFFRVSSASAIFYFS